MALVGAITGRGQLEMKKTTSFGIEFWTRMRKPLKGAQPPLPKDEKRKDKRKQSKKSRKGKR